MEHVLEQAVMVRVSILKAILGPDIRAHEGPVETTLGVGMGVHRGIAVPVLGLGVRAQGGLVELVFLPCCDGTWLCN